MAVCCIIRNSGILISVDNRDYSKICFYILGADSSGDGIRGD